MKWLIDVFKCVFMGLAVKDRNRREYYEELCQYLLVATDSELPPDLKKSLISSHKS